MTELANTPSTDSETLRRQQIMRAVVECVVAEGIEGATMRRVAERAGVSTGMVTYYFRNKEELIDTTLAAAAHELSEHVEQLAGHTYGLARMEKAAELVLMDPQASGFPPISFWMEFWAAATRKEHLRERFVQALERNSESYRQSVEIAANDAGREIDVALSVSLLSALIRGLRIDSDLAGESLTPTRALDVYRYCLRLLFAVPEAPAISPHPVKPNRRRYSRRNTREP